MRFEIPKKENPNIKHYSSDDLKIAYKFSAETHKEFGSFIKAIVIFGSTARKAKTPRSDIDILVIVDDISIALTQELTEAYRIIVKKIIIRTSVKLHVISLRLTSFWEYIRNGDPIGINILRDGIALIDTGFFNPLQALLMRGRIRPTPESIWIYFIRAPNTLHNSKWHILQATLDLYWAAVDACHAALMKIGEIPPTPEHVADLLEDKLVKKKLLEHKYVVTMRELYKLSKMITHREIREIKGSEYDRYFDETADLVAKMRKIIEGK
ncbi:MAG: nucleotidyltransferase domain-containing protein [Nanoarchaeota archaeon]